jgi:GT2 family glycosyltransferase
MDVTIIVPTYFGGNLLYQCIDSIHKNVENAKILIYKNDVGWLKACNEAVKLVDSDVILLNDDTVVLTDIVKGMHDLAYSRDDIGIVGGKALSPTNPDKIINYGIYIGIDGNTAHKHFGQDKDSVDVEYQKAVEGSCMYIKRSIIEDYGLFDEGYGNGYREEVDLSFRIREQGKSVVSCPTAEYIHYVSQTNGKLGIANTTFDYFMSKWKTKLELGLV